MINLYLIKLVKKNLIIKIITSIFVQGLALIVPIFWSKIINNLSLNNFNKCYNLIIIIILLTSFYYLWAYLNQKSWFRLYDKLYLELNKKLEEDKINKLSLGGYTNVVNNDIDIIATFFCNSVTRIFQILEFIVIYIYFFSLNIYIFIVTIIVSLLMLFIIILTSKKMEHKNINRKNNLDEKTIMSHEVYNTLKENKRDKEIYKKFFISIKEYLKDNTDFNLYTNYIIYSILGIIEFVQYILIFYGIFLVANNNLELGSITLIYSYYAKIIVNFEVLGTINADFQSFKVSLKRLKEII